MTTQDAGPQREPDERVREALAFYDDDTRRYALSAGDHGKVLAAEVRRLQAAQREPVAWALWDSVCEQWIFTQHPSERERREWTPLYTQAQRDDHPPLIRQALMYAKTYALAQGWPDKADEFQAALISGRDDHPTEGLRDWRKDAEDALRCAGLSRKKATITLLQRLLAKLDAALAASKGTPDFVPPVSSPDQTLSAPSAVAQCADQKTAFVQQAGPARALAALTQEQREGLRQHLRGHYLWHMECDERLKRDRPTCSCSLDDLGWHPNVGAATAAWVEHVLDRMPIPEPPKDVRSQAKEKP